MQTQTQTECMSRDLDYVDADRSCLW